MLLDEDRSYCDDEVKDLEKKISKKEGITRVLTHTECKYTMYLFVANEEDHLRLQGWVNRAEAALRSNYPELDISLELWTEGTGMFRTEPG